MIANIIRASVRARGIVIAVALLLAAIGVATAIFAYVRWESNERAMRTAKRLTYSVTLPLLSIGLGLVGFVILALAIVEHK